MTDTDDKHRCGRRDDRAAFFGPADPAWRAAQPREDGWRMNKDDGCLGASQRACTYCGSMHPEDFLDAVEAGATVGPTDKNYKAYVEGLPDGRSHKFYFQHLDEAQRARFIELHNSGRMKIGYPGYFYVKPYFASRV